MFVATGKPSAEQLAQIRTRKPAPPVIEVTLADGSKVPLCNTFKDQQVCEYVLDPMCELQSTLALLSLTQHLHSQQQWHHARNCLPNRDMHSMDA